MSPCPGKKSLIYLETFPSSFRVGGGSLHWKCLAQEATATCRQLAVARKPRPRASYLKRTKQGAGYYVVRTHIARANARKLSLLYIACWWSSPHTLLLRVGGKVFRISIHSRAGAPSFFLFFLVLMRTPTVPSSNTYYEALLLLYMLHSSDPRAATFPLKNSEASGPTPTPLIRYGNYYRKKLQGRAAGGRQEEIYGTLQNCM